jgi:flagellar basal-body rod protein FlgF/flagellar basal-body rod protein FlgG
LRALGLRGEEKLNSGYYAACAGLQAQSQALELVANNLANISTTGYRAQQALFRSLLPDSVANSADPLNRAVNDFSMLGGSQTDLSAGTLERTGNSLDLAIEGTGFFAIKAKAGTLYTRNGNFQVSPKGQLTTAAGDLVLGEQGPIAVPTGQISISPDGTLSSDGAVVEKLRVVEFAPGTAPVAAGKSYYSAPQTNVRLAGDSYVRQGMLESSNVNSVSAVVQLIAIQRRAEMLERAMSAFQSNLDHIAANDLPHV